LVYVGDAPGTLLDALHGLHDLAHDRATAFGHRTGRDGQLVGLVRMVGIQAHGRVELLHRGSRLLQRTGLLLGARAQVLVGLGDLAAGRGHALGATAHLRHHRAQALQHLPQGAQQQGRLAAPLRIDAHPQIAIGHGAGHLHRLLQRPGDRADDPQRQYHGRAQRQRDGHPHGELDGRHCGAGIGHRLLLQFGLQGNEGIRRLDIGSEHRAHLLEEVGARRLVLPLAHQIHEMLLPLDGTRPLRLQGGKQLLGAWLPDLRRQPLHEFVHALSLGLHGLLQALEFVTALGNGHIAQSDGDAIGVVADVVEQGHPRHALVRHHPELLVEYSAFPERHQAQADDQQAHQGKTQRQPGGDLHITEIHGLLLAGSWHGWAHQTS